MKRGDNIPPKDADFDSFQSNLITQVTANTAAWGIMAAALALLLPLQMAWAAAWAIAKIKVNRSPGAVATKNQARAAYVTALRMFLRSNIFGNPLMTPGDIELCGLKPYDHTRTLIPVPVVQPIVNLHAFTGWMTKRVLSTAANPIMWLKLSLHLPSPDSQPILRLVLISEQLPVVLST